MVPLNYPRILYKQTDQVGDNSCYFPGERLTSDEIDVLIHGMEDSNGLINYEGKQTLSSL